MLAIKTTVDGIGKIERVNKTVARKAFNDKKHIFLLPSNFWPCNNGMGYPSCIMISDKPFDDIVNEFEFYNCNNSETGYYTNFYLKVD